MVPLAWFAVGLGFVLWLTGTLLVYAARSKSKAGSERPARTAALNPAVIGDHEIGSIFRLAFHRSNRIEPRLRSFAVHTGGPVVLHGWRNGSWARERSSRWDRSVTRISLAEKVWAATRGEGIAVVEEDDQKARESRSRLDLAGRLFRPHWRLFRGSRASSAEPGAIRSRRRDAGGIDSTQLPLDVLCGGMYRACSTWQYEVAAHLIEQYLGGQRLGYLTGDQYAARLRSDAVERDERIGANHTMEGRQVARRRPIVRPRAGRRTRGWRSMPIVTCAKWSFH